MSRAHMFRALLFVQWKHQRHELAFLALFGALIPPVTMWMALTGSPEPAARVLLDVAPGIGGFGAVFAASTGLALAIRPYWLDARSNHTYALALPLPRTRYGLLRAAAGATLILFPALGFLIGALLSIQVAPATSLHAYPIGLAVRFVLAALAAFAIGFGIQYGLGRHAMRWTLITIATVAGVELFGQLTMRTSLTGPFFELLLREGSPLRIFWDRWMLFDV
jgi:hypothetical protein